MKFSIPNPCTEDWSKMTPNEKGSFCASCCKTVHDFTNRTTEEILRVLRGEERVCGRFRKSRLLPVAVPGSGMRRLRIFAYALWVTFGMTLFSCGPGEEEHPVGEVDWVDSTKRTMGEIPAPADTLKDTLNGEVQEEEMIGKAAKKETATSQTTASSPSSKETNTEQVEQNDNTPKHPRHNPLPLEPKWTGGDHAAIQDFIKKNVKYPEQARKNGVTGTVHVVFTVKADGETADHKVWGKSLGHGCDEEAIRVVKQLGKWQPGKQMGKPADMEYTVAVPFE